MTTVSTVTCGAEVIVARRCPECRHKDTIVLSAVRAALWYLHDTRTISGLQRLSDSLRDARGLGVIEPGGHDRPAA